MEQEKKTSTFEQINNWIKRSVTLKLIVIGIIALLLLIPGSMVDDVIRERKNRSSASTKEVSIKWGDKQTITGPIITIPYYTSVKQNDGSFQKFKHFAHFLPNKLDVDGNIETKIKKRGIYEIPLYSSNIKLIGRFASLNFDRWNIDTSKILWEEAYVSMGITDLKGVRDAIQFKTSITNLEMESGTPQSSSLESGVHAPFPNLSDTAFTFSLTLSLNGSQALRFIPVGKTTQVQLASNWKDPKFNGNSLPDNSEVNQEGFKASWKVLDLNRNFPQQWIGKQNLHSASFGVDLYQPVDHYQKNERSSKYSFLILFLTFITFFFIEVMNKKRIHPIQYILIGFSLSLFYLLLLSFSEHLGFNTAYMIASTTITSMISLYGYTIIKKTRVIILMILFFILIYGFIFVILQLTDFALLVGSLGLVITIAAAMYFSRNINWYKLSSPQ